MPLKSAPNWGAVLLGASPERTGLDDNCRVRRKQGTAHRYVPSLFEVFKAQRPSGRAFGVGASRLLEGILVGKQVFGETDILVHRNPSPAFDTYLIPSSRMYSELPSADFEPCRSPCQGGPSSEQRCIKTSPRFIPARECSRVQPDLTQERRREIASEGEHDRAVINRLMGELQRATPAQLIWAYLHQVDAAGHYGCWNSPHQERATRTIDGLLDRVLDYIKEHQHKFRGTLVVVTADHGGTGPQHGEEPAAAEAERLVPLLVFGPHGIEPGEVLGTASVLDVPMTIAASLNLSVPDDWEGRVIAGLFTEPPPPPQPVAVRLGIALTVPQSAVADVDPCGDTLEFSYFFSGRAYTRSCERHGPTLKMNRGYPRRIGYAARSGGHEFPTWPTEVETSTAGFAHNGPNGWRMHFFQNDGTYLIWDPSRHCVEAGAAGHMCPGAENRVVRIRDRWPGMEARVDAALEVDEGTTVLLFTGLEVRSYIMVGGAYQVARTTSIAETFADFPPRTIVDAATTSMTSDGLRAYLFSDDKYWIYDLNAVGRYARLTGPERVVSHPSGSWPGLLLRIYPSPPTP